MKLPKQKSVLLEQIVEKMELRNLTPKVPFASRKVYNSEINRPALQLAGYFGRFTTNRVQAVGQIEQSYLETLEREHKREIYEKLLSYEDIPCFVFCRGIEPDEDFLEVANQNKIPVFMTQKLTSNFMGEYVRWMNVQLAPTISIHGVLVDVYGEGVLITGESGVGKSEAALELLRRGHRLVTDDVVEIHKVSGVTLVGMAPDITKHFIELRGIGIVDVKSMFGVECVKETQGISFVIKLEEWDKSKRYDRIGLEEEYTEILGIKLPCHSIPIRPGRNLAIIVETAAVNFRQKQMGYNAAEELYNRIQKNMGKKPN
ncbi:MAG: HPr(Ser) kinase/phosphatase [Clostridiales bacterium]|nr:HPr(Ser) kinase/phosphatase [Clostridiales bacterium]